MVNENESQIPIRKMNVTRITLEDRPIGQDETREIGVAVKPQEKPVGLENGSIVIEIRLEN